MNGRDISIVLTAFTILGLTSVHIFGAVAITDPGLGFLNSPGTPTHPVTEGYQFRVGSADLLITALGIWDSGADGLASSHQVGLWDSSGVLLAGATVLAGTSSTRLGEFRYQSISASLALAAGGTYTVATAYAAFDPDQLHTAAPSGPTFSADIQSPVPRYIVDQFAFPTDSIGGAPYVGPNFQYTVVPEPPGSLLLLFGTAALILKTIFRRHPA